MIQGHVNAGLEPMLRLNLIAPDGGRTEVEAVLDTGFDGFLSLHSQVIASLQFPLIGVRDYELGDGSLISFNVHEARIVWDGAAQLVPALDSDGDQLVGTALLRDHSTYIEFRTGGIVRIESLA